MRAKQLVDAAHRGGIDSVASFSRKVLVVVDCVVKRTISVKGAAVVGSK
jgi:hypothetical protein